MKKNVFIISLFFLFLSFAGCKKNNEIKFDNSYPLATSPDVEWAARSILGWEDADSTEFIQNSEHAIISLPEEQAGLSASGLMQLGAATVKITKGTKLHDAYKKSTIVERHRNKYTFDRKYSKDMTEHGLIPCAISELDKRTEAFEWENHKWGVGVQYHPEFVSRPTKPHPLFTAFIGAALDK